MLEKIEAERKVAEAELSVMPLGDYDLLYCMIDENLTQQHVGPKTIFEIVAAALELEKQAKVFLGNVLNRDPLRLS